MNSHELLRRYNFSDAELIQAAAQQLRLMTRDIAEFSEYNFDATKQANYESVLDIFTNFPTDTILEGEKMVLTELKNETRKKLETSIRDIQFMAKLAFADTPAYLKVFGDNYLSRQTDNDILDTSRTVAKSIVKYNQQLSLSGLTPAKTNLFEQAFQAFAAAYSDMEDAIHERDIATNNRILAANNLYNLYSLYAQLGQHIWAEKNEAKYNDYIIYNNHSTNGANTAAETL